ncbi:hypothetical protein V6N13_148688 [Hibiscus sabdariffa]
MGSRFEVLEDEVVVMGDWPAVEGHAAFSTSNQGAKGVVIEPLGSAKLRVGVSAGSPRKRDDVKEGQIVSSGTESGLKVLDADYVERESILDRGNRLIDTCALAFEAPQHHLSSGFTVGHSVLVETIHALRRSDWQTRITHIGRERNEVADKLAALGKHQSLEGVVFAALPDAVGVGLGGPIIGGGIDE